MSVDAPFVNDEDSPYKIIVLVPSHESNHALFTYDLCQMMNLSVAAIPAHLGHELGFAMNIGTYIHKARTELLQVALGEGATHVLWIDSDMRFPQDALLRLLQHQVPVVGINYSKRRWPPEFVAIKRVPTKEGDVGEMLRTDADSTGLEEVDAIGMGLVLMETDFMVNLPDPEKDPWFKFKMMPDGREVGEDVYFCKFIIKDLLKEKIFVDHDLSWQCSHLGTHEYRCGHAALMDDEEFKQAISEESE